MDDAFKTEIESIFEQTSITEALEMLREIVLSGEYSEEFEWELCFGTGEDGKWGCEVYRSPLAILQEHYLGATIETARLDDSIYWRDQFVNGQEEMDGELHFSPTEVGYMQFGREFTGLFEVAICYCTTADALSVIDKRLIELYLDALA